MISRFTFTCDHPVASLFFFFFFFLWPLSYWNSSLPSVLLLRFFITFFRDVKAFWITIVQQIMLVCYLLFLFHLLPSLSLSFPHPLL